MKTIQLPLSDALYRHLSHFAETDQTSVERLILRAVYCQIQREGFDTLIKQRGGSVSREELLKILDSVPNVPPVPGDELPEGYAERHNLKSTS